MTEAIERVSVDLVGKSRVRDIAPPTWGSPSVLSCEGKGFVSEMEVVARVDARDSELRPDSQATRPANTPIAAEQLPPPISSICRRHLITVKPRLHQIESYE